MMMVDFRAFLTLDSTKKGILMLLPQIMEIKILANVAGLGSLRATEPPPVKNGIDSTGTSMENHGQLRQRFASEFQNVSIRNKEKKSLSQVPRTVGTVSIARVVDILMIFFLRHMVVLSVHNSTSNSFNPHQVSTKKNTYVECYVIFCFTVN